MYALDIGQSICLDVALHPQKKERKHDHIAREHQRREKKSKGINTCLLPRWSKRDGELLLKAQSACISTSFFLSAFAGFSPLLGTSVLH